MTSLRFVRETAQKLLDQGRFSIVGGVCQYRGFDSCKCGIGIWIPDELYDADLEGKTIALWWDRRPGIRAYFTELIDPAGFGPHINGPNKELLRFLIWIQNELHDKLAWDNDKLTSIDEAESAFRESFPWYAPKTEVQS